MVGFNQQELDECRPLAMRVAEFCARRWKMEYEEIIGSTSLLEALLRAPAQIDSIGPEFVVVPPGGEIEAQMFIREREVAPQPMGRDE